MAKKIEELASRVSRWFHKQLGVPAKEAPPSGSEENSHPGRAYHARTVLDESEGGVREHRGGRPYQGNPHVGSWMRYTTHLFHLMLEGHGRSPAATHIRDRLAFHWNFLSQKERTKCLEHYRSAKLSYAERKVAHDTASARRDRDWLFTKDLYAEVEDFMSPKVH